MRKFVFLDRDGVINLKPSKGDYITDWEDFQFTPGIKTTLKHLINNGYILFVVTNQQCIGKNILSLAGLDFIHAKMLEELNKSEIEIKKIYYCPHLIVDNCKCRKPKAGMFELAAKEYSFQNNEVNSALMVGDSETDILAGKKFGCKTVLLRSELSVDDHTSSCADFIISEICDLQSIIDI